jgi:hypothetical protein
MKVENHDTTKLGNQHENLLKRKIQRIHYVEIRQGQRCNHICVTGTCY